MNIVSIRKWAISLVESIVLTIILSLLATIGALSMRASMEKSYEYGSKAGPEIAGIFSGTVVPETACSDAAWLISGTYGDVALFEAASSYAGIREFRSHGVVLAGTAPFLNGRGCLLKFSGSGSGSSETVLPIEAPEIVNVNGFLGHNVLGYSFLEIATRAEASSKKESLTGTVWTPPKKSVAK